MSNKASISSVLVNMLPTFSTGSNSFFSRFVMISTIFVLFITFLPYASSSPTPSSISMESNNNNNIDNKIVHGSNAFMFNPNNYQTNLQDDSSAPSSSSSSVHEQQISAPSSPIWFGQPRTQANQFLMSHVNDNDIIVPKWFVRHNNNDDDNDDDDEINDYIPSGIVVNKRSSYYNAGGHQTLKKRKQQAKPPMEVMNEIVNSIYL
ncbi:unnamed protein product [Adineta steineri]|uniref:Uncharacterized protein n=1 Tax=Adineta steineri TaxID=433720 RepID=A0A818U8P5_9BILA|nr:unnamed protein product [Adineta steineri]